MNVTLFPTILLYIFPFFYLCVRDLQTAAIILLFELSRNTHTKHSDVVYNLKVCDRL